MRVFPLRNQLIVSSCFCLLLGAFGCPQSGDEPGDAMSADAGTANAIRLNTVVGDVQWKTGKAGAWQKVTEGQAVERGDSLKTGPDSSVLVVFPDGGTLKLSANSSVDLMEIDDEFAFLMEQGEVEVSAQRAALKGFRMVLAQSSDIMLVRDGQARLTMSPDGVRVQMVMGNATIVQNGEKKTIDTGASFLLSIGQSKIVVRQSLDTALLDRNRFSRVKSPNDKAFRPTRGRQEVLQPKTALQTLRGGGVELRDSAGGQLFLGNNSRAVFEEATLSEQGREAKLSLEQGEVKIKLQRTASSASFQEVNTPLAKILASASGLTAEAEVNSSAKATRMVIHSGKADIIAGDTKYQVLAGQTLTIEPNGKSVGPISLPISAIRSLEGSRSRVFYDRDHSEVNFSWAKGNLGDGLSLELSSTPDFKKPYLREPVYGTSFCYRHVKPGKTFWRLIRRSAQGENEIAGPVSVVELERDPLAGRITSSALNNVVPDTGIQTTILFQGKSPALTFKWDPVDRAVTYRVRMYTEDNMEQPVFDERVPKNSMLLPAGKLKDGTYFWYQAACDAQEKEIRTSQMNKLSLTFDNSAAMLRIESPRPGEARREGKVEIRGSAPPGSTVTVNGQAVSLSADGRFGQTISNVPPFGTLLFHLKKSAQGDIFFVRHVGK